MLGSLLLSLLILPFALPQFTKTVDQKLDDIKARVNVQYPKLDNLLAGQEEEETLHQAAAAAGGVRAAQLERLLEITELANVTGRQNVLLHEDINVVKGWLAIAAIFSSVYMILSSLYMIVYMIVYIKKCVKKHQERLTEKEFELMESRLASRKAKRRSGMLSSQYAQKITEMHHKYA